MILRRFAQALKEQNWAAITIEFVLLVLGVFLGIQVANWNQALADQRLGRAYAERLTRDLEQDLAGRRSLVAYYAAVLDSVERADALLADPQSDAAALVINAYRATEINYRPPSRATWDEIVSAGHVGLLPTEAARSAAEYFAFDVARNNLDILGQSDYRHRVRSMVPLAMQQVLRAKCSDVRDGLEQIIGFMPDCSLDVDPAAIAATAAALRSDPVVTAELRNQYSNVYSAHRNLSGDAGSIEQALAAMKAARAADEAAP